MNQIDLNAPNEPVLIERHTYVDGLQGFEPGLRRELAVLGDPVRVGLGKRS